MDQPRDKMDRTRLKQIEQSDLTEGRVNQDFVYWLKTKGPNWLLLILAALCVYMVIVRWKQHGVQKTTDAWESLMTADLPRSLEDVATEYKSIDAVPELALMQAGRRYLQSVRSGRTLSSALAPPTDPNNPTPVPVTEALTDEQRVQYLDEASRLYQAALDSLNSRQKDVAAEALLKVGVYEGLASVAEARGDATAASNYYNQAAEVASANYPKLAEQARNRAANVESTIMIAALPTAVQTGGSALSQGYTADTPSTIRMSPSLQRMLDAVDDGVAGEPTASAGTPSGSQ